MRPREKHLREALGKAKYTFNEIECAIDKLADQGMEDAEKAKQEADLMQDGPSEDDKERLRQIGDYIEGGIKPGIYADYMFFMFEKLKKEWG